MADEPEAYVCVMFMFCHSPAFDPIIKIKPDDFLLPNWQHETTFQIKVRSVISLPLAYQSYFIYSMFRVFLHTCWPELNKKRGNYSHRALHWMIWMRGCVWDHNTYVPYMWFIPFRLSWLRISLCVNTFFMASVLCFYSSSVEETNTGNNFCHKPWRWSISHICLRENPHPLWYC